MLCIALSHSRSARQACQRQMIMKRFQVSLWLASFVTISESDFSTTAHWSIQQSRRFCSCTTVPWEREQWHPMQSTNPSPFSNREQQGGESKAKATTGPHGHNTAAIPKPKRAKQNPRGAAPQKPPKAKRAAEQSEAAPARQAPTRPHHRGNWQGNRAATTSSASPSLSPGSQPHRLQR